MKERGRVRLLLEGLGAERLINELWKKQVPLARVRRSPKRGVVLESRERDWQLVAKTAGSKGFRVTVLKPGFGQRIRTGLKRRWALAAGLLLGTALSALAFSFVWAVEVENAGAYAGEVRLFLEENNIRPGIPLAGVDAARVQDGLQWRLPRVKWVWVKKEGVRLKIKLEEGVTKEQRPAASGDVVAARAGVLERLTVFAGTPVCKAGDAVEAGQVLIEGREMGRDGAWQQVQAAGEAVARVWASESVRMETRELKTAPTGRQKERILFQTPFGVYTWEEEPAYLLADREYTVYGLPGVWLPVQVVLERVTEVSGEWVARDEAEVAREAQQAAEEALVRAWPGTRDIDKFTKISMIERGIIEVTATAQWTEDIAQYGSMP